MEPLIVLVAVTLLARLIGAFGVTALRSWRVALRGGFAAMFVLTGVSHFVGMREEMIAMVPPALPAAGVLVTVTGVLELAGAVGLLLGRTHRLAAACLGLLLLGMFPANVHAALEGIHTTPMDTLLPRTLLQLVFVAVAVVLALPDHRRQRMTEPASLSA